MLTSAPVATSYDAPQLVTLADAGTEAIYYTVDGSVPQYAGYARSWDDGLLSNQTNVSSNGTAGFTNPGALLRQTLTASASSATSFLDSAPVPVFTSSGSLISTKFRFNSSCTTDTRASVVYRCTGKFAANDTYGYTVGVSPRGGIVFGRGSNTSVGGYVEIGTAPLSEGLAIGVWHTLTVTVAGHLHVVRINGVVRAQWRDNTYTSPGFVGVRTYAGTATTPVVDYDDFRVEFFTGAKYESPIPVVPATTPTTIKALSVTETTASSVSDFIYEIGSLRTQQPTLTVDDTTVAMATPTPNATIYYTTDGSAPRLTSGPATAIGSTGTVTDPRDGKVYRTVLMPDGKWWLAENFAYAGAGRWPNDSSNTAAREYGRLYTAAQAVTYAIPGCHVPTRAEQNALGALVAFSSLKRMATGSWSDGGAPWLSPNTGALNAYGFDVLGSGSFAGNVWQSNLGQFGYIISSDGYAIRVSYTAGADSVVSVASDYAGSVRLIVDSGNVTEDVVTPAENTKLYTAPIPYVSGMVVSTLARATGYLDSLPQALYPADLSTGTRANQWFLWTGMLSPTLAHQSTWLLPKARTEELDWISEMEASSMVSYAVTGTALQAPEPPSWPGATCQQQFMPDEGIQVSVFPSQPHIFTNQVDWGNGPITNRTLKVFWRIPQNSAYELATDQTSAKIDMTLGNLEVVEETQVWAIGGAQAQATIGVPSGEHYVSGDVSLGFMTGAVESQVVPVIGGRNSAPTSLWQSPATGGARRYVLIECAVLLGDPDRDQITYQLLANGVMFASGTNTSGTVVTATYNPMLAGTLELSAILTDYLGAQSNVPGPVLEVVDNSFAVGAFKSPINNYVGRAGKKTPVVFSISDVDADPMTWQLLCNGVVVASGSSSTDVDTTYKQSLSHGLNQMSLIVADTLGSSYPVQGPTIWGSNAEILDLTFSGSLSSAEIDITPVLSGSVVSVEYVIVSNASTQVISSLDSGSGFAISYVPDSASYPDTVLVTATAYDSDGYGFEYSESITITSGGISGSGVIAESPDTVIGSGSVISFNPPTVQIVSTIPAGVAQGAVLPVEASIMGPESSYQAWLEYKRTGTTTWTQIPMTLNEG